jgi:hypothetical protein
LNEKLDGCDEVRLSEAVGLDKRRTMSNAPHKLPALKTENLPRCRAKSCCGEGRQASAKLGETHEPKHWQSKRLTLELSGGVAVRLNEMLELNDVYIAGELT